METRNGNNFITWKRVAIASVSMLMTIGGYLYGEMSSRVGEVERQVKVNTPRLSALEAWKDVHVQTQEVQTQDMKKWMERIEGKLDRLIEKKK